jgi:hypothetical protein
MLHNTFASKWSLPFHPQRCMANPRLKFDITASIPLRHFFRRVSIFPLVTIFFKDPTRALEEALRKYGTPEIFNTDQGSQFTSEAFTDILNNHGISISMDGRGRWGDNVFVERLWKSVKYEEVYLKAYGSLTEARRELAAYFEFYNSRRRHQGLDDRTSDEVYCTTLPQRKVAA